MRFALPVLLQIFSYNGLLARYSNLFLKFHLPPPPPFAYLSHVLTYSFICANERVINPLNKGLHVLLIRGAYMRFF